MVTRRWRLPGSTFTSPSARPSARTATSRCCARPCRPGSASSTTWWPRCPSPRASGPTPGRSTPCTSAGARPRCCPPRTSRACSSACREHLALAAAPWVFLEANPEDVTPDACAAWRGLGVRTLSLGVQSFSDDALRFLGRRHDAQPGAGRGRGRTRRGLRHRLGRPHLRPARPDRGGLAARARDGRGAVAGAPVVLPAHDPPAHALRGERHAGRAHRAARRQAGRALRAHAPLPRRTRAGPRTRSPTSRAAPTTSRATTASTGTTRPTSGSARRRTRSPSKTRGAGRRPAAGGTSRGRRAGRAAWRRASGRSRARSFSARRRWRPRR